MILRTCDPVTVAAVMADVLLPPVTKDGEDAAEAIVDQRSIQYGIIDDVLQ